MRKSPLLSSSMLQERKRKTKHIASWVFIKIDQIFIRWIIQTGTDTRFNRFIFFFFFFCFISFSGLNSLAWIQNYFCFFLLLFVVSLFLSLSMIFSACRQSTGQSMTQFHKMHMNRIWLDSRENETENTNEWARIWQTIELNSICHLIEIAFWIMKLTQILTIVCLYVCVPMWIYLYGVFGNFC